VGIAVVEVLVNRRLQFSHAAEHAPANPLFGDVAEKAFDEVDPRQRGRREVQMKPRVLGQPVLDVRIPRSFGR
jgi:hypothetical protein